MDDIDAVAAIRDPVRGALLRLVRTSTQPVTRDAAAAALELPRSTVAFHLDRLVDAGFLQVEHRRLTGRTGPGSGRPSKIYSATDLEISVSIPDRRYDLMSELLAAGIAEAAADGTPVLDALRAASERAGVEAGAAAGSIEGVLEASGYGPTINNNGVELVNCPFHRLVARHTEIVCAANHAFLTGAMSSTGGDPTRVRLEPAPGRCCVRLANL